MEKQIYGPISIVLLLGIIGFLIYKFNPNNSIVKNVGGIDTSTYDISNSPVIDPNASWETPFSLRYNVSTYNPFPSVLPQLTQGLPAMTNSCGGCNGE